MAANAPRRAAWLRWLALAGALAAGVLVVYAPLLLTNRVQGAGDAFTYFTPYRDYVNAALRTGRLPLWNPYLFMGVPFLANPQTAVFYPLHWPFIFLTAAKSLQASLALHLWLTSLGAAVYARRVARLGWLAALVTGLVWSLSGYLGARAGQVNQISVAAWLPWLLTLLEQSTPRWRLGHAAPTAPRVNGLAWAGLSAAIALQLLAGHSQSSFIVLTGLLLAALWPGLAALLVAAVQLVRRQRLSLDRIALGAAVGRGALVLAAVLLAVLLAALQLLPTLELSGLSIRSGGLSLREAVAFSLQPRGLLLTFLPSYGENLAERFATPAFGEYVGYVGVSALLLAAWGAVQGRKRGLASVWGLAVALGGVGVAFALGAYDPLYLLLVKLVPGFDLFRAPARWLLLYTFGVSLLAGYGAHALTQPPPAQRRARPRGWLPWTVGLLGVAALAVQHWPGARSWLGWLIAVAAMGGIVWLRRHVPRAAWLLAPLLLAELIAASLTLDHRYPTAPEAVTSLRPATAYLLSATQEAEAAGQIPGRFLSMSGITYDPGDQAALQRMVAAALPARSIYDLIVASKLQEIAAPNLSLLWRLPAVDGYDGGVLPLRRTVDLQTLFIPAGAVAEDGRLREQVLAVPPSRLLRLAGIEYVLTDKTFDLWHDDVYYDLELSTRLGPGQQATVTAGALEATGLGVWSYLDGGAALAAGEPVAEISVEGAARSETFVLRAGVDTAEGRWRADAGHVQPAAQHPWPRGEAGWDYLARFDWESPFTPQRIVVRQLAATGTVVLRGASLVDSRTAAHAALTLPADGAFRRVYSGDVKIYQNEQALPRARVVGRVTAVADDAAALARLAAPDFDPAREVVIGEDELAAAGLAAADFATDTASDAPPTVLEYRAERAAFDLTLAAPGVLVLADTWFPGWQVQVDGQPAALLRADYLFRGVALNAGQHRVVLTYRPASLRRGAWLSGAAALLWLVVLVLGRRQARRQVR